NRDYKIFPKILWKAIFQPPRWNNLEKILRLEKQYDINSIFFWLTEQGKSQLLNEIYIDHADYTFHMKSIRHLWEQIKGTGSHNGLHKSAFPTTFQDELQ